MLSECMIKRVSFCEKRINYLVSLCGFRGSVFMIKERKDGYDK